MLSVIMLSVVMMGDAFFIVMLSVVMLNVVMLNVMAPTSQAHHKFCQILNTIPNLFMFPLPMT